MSNESPTQIEEVTVESNKRGRSEGQNDVSDKERIDELKSEIIILKKEAVDWERKAAKLQNDENIRLHKHNLFCRRLEREYKNLTTATGIVSRSDYDGEPEEIKEMTRILFDSTKTDASISITKINDEQFKVKTSSGDGCVIV